MKSDYKYHIDAFIYKNSEFRKYLFITGWCFRQDGSEHQLHIKVDDQEVNYTIDVLDRIDVSKHLKGATDGKGIGFTIRVPFTQDKIHSFQFIADDTVLFKRNEGRLNKVMDVYPFDYQIEMYVQDDNKASLSGWCASLNDEDIKLMIVDEQGKEVKSTLQRINRNDLVEKAVVEPSQNMCGFHFDFECQPKQKYNLRIQSKDYTKDVRLKLQQMSNGALLRAYKNALNEENLRKAYHYLKEKGVRKFLARLKYGPGDNNINYNTWRLSKIPSAEELQKQRETKFEIAPKVSLIVATFNTPIPFLKEMIGTVEEQTYRNWELCIADGSMDSKVIDYIKKNYEGNDKIKWTSLDKNYGIAGNMNAAMDLATGDYIALYDHDDTVTPDALYEFISALNKNPELEVFYSDEDKMNSDGSKYFEPHFKPDFNIDLLCTVNYICHFFMVKKTIIDQVGKLDSAYDGAQDYDFILKCTECAGPEKIYHVPKVLYHWRTHEQSTSSNPESKMYAFDAGTRAVQAHYDRLGIHATVEKGECLGLYRTKYILDTKPLISIIIPNMDHIDDLDRCIQSIEKKSTYKNYEYIIIENNSRNEETFEYYKKLEAENPKAHVVYWKGIFNYSAINNFGAEHAHGDYYLLLNNDTEIINDDCLEELLGYCMRKDVGAVGARLFYEDDTIQHAGVIVGLGGIAGHCFVGLPKDKFGYFSRVICAQDYSAVTAACMMVKKEVFEQVGGLNENLKVAFNDVDFCMKIRQANYLIVYNPYAMLHHYESKSRGLEDTPEKVARFNNEIHTFESRWPDILKNGDPFYNPNLSLNRSDFALKKD